MVFIICHIKKIFLVLEKMTINYFMIPTIIIDSFGLSSCVNFPYDLNTKLKKLSDKKILNISKGGTGPYYQKNY